MSVRPTDPKHVEAPARSATHGGEVINFDSARNRLRPVPKKRPRFYRVALSHELLQSAPTIESIITKSSNPALVNNICDVLSSAVEVDRARPMSGPLYEALSHEVGRQHKVTEVEGCEVYFSICEETELVEIELIFSPPSEPDAPPRSPRRLVARNAWRLLGIRRVLLGAGRILGVLVVGAALAFLIGYFSARSQLGIRGTLVVDTDRPVTAAVTETRAVGAAAAGVLAKPKLKPQLVLHSADRPMVGSLHILDGNVSSVADALTNGTRSMTRSASVGQDSDEASDESNYARVRFDFGVLPSEPVPGSAVVKK